MEDKKDIGRAVREKLSGLEMKPAPGGWDALNAQLHQKKKRRVLPLWWWATALVVVSFGAGFLFYSGNSTGDADTKAADGVPVAGRDGSVSRGKDSDSHTNDIQEKEDNAAGTQTDNSNSANAIARNDSGESASASSGKNNAAAKSGNEVYTEGRPSVQKPSGRNKNGENFRSKGYASRSENKLERKIQDKNATKGMAGNDALSGKSEDENADAGNAQKYDGIEGNSSDVNITAVIEKSKTQADSLALAQNELAKCADSLRLAEKKKRESHSKRDTLPQRHYKPVYVFAYVAPTLYNYFGGYSIDGNSEGGLAPERFNYGAYAGINLTDRWGVRVGVASNKLEHRSPGIPSGAYVDGVQYNPGQNSATVAAQLGSPETVDIYQELQYLEVPIEATFRFSTGKVAVGAIGGFSTIYLRNNEVSARANGGSVTFGELKDAKDINFTANIGVGFYYEFVRNLQLNVEPTFRYHFNTINGSTPYSGLVRAGLQYTFDTKKKK
ncbi:MAG: hypothetical protein ACO1N9_12530 [Flavobacterium sp.]